MVFKIPDSMQLGDSSFTSISGGMGDTSYIFATRRTATCMSATCIGTMASWTGTTTGSTTTGIVRIRLLPSQIFLFLSHNYLLGEFCFISCPFQPPNIFPISSIFRDRAVYFLLSKLLVSHKIIKSILRVSIFLIPTLTYGCFSFLFKKLAWAIISILSTNITPKTGTPGT